MELDIMIFKFILKNKGPGYLLRRTEKRRLALLYTRVYFEATVEQNCEPGNTHGYMYLWLMTNVAYQIMWTRWHWEKMFIHVKKDELNLYNITKIDSP